MRIAFVSVRYPFGHAEPYLGTELSALARECDALTVVPIRRASSRRELPEGVDLLDMPMYSPRCFVLAVEAILTRPARVFGALACLLHARSTRAAKFKNVAVLLKGLALAAWARKHRIEHLHAYWLSTPATVAFVAAFVADIPWSASAHRWDIYEENALDVKVRHAQFIRTISNRGQRDVRTRVHADLADRVCCLPMGVVVPPPPKQRAAASPPPIRLLCPAALVEVKGHETLLQALAILRARGRAVSCDLAGTGPLGPALRRRAKQLGLDELVTFRGFVDQRELHAALARGEYAAVVLSSNSGENDLMEGVPAALIEAMARGVAVIATDSGSVGELVDATTGTLVPPANPAALAEGIVDTLDDAARTQARTITAYDRVRQRHELAKQMHALANRIKGIALVPERTHS